MLYRARTLLRPRTLDAALQARADHPDAVVVAGGTGVLPRLNQGWEPAALLDLSAVDELRAARRDGAVVRLGALTTYTQVLERWNAELPGLAAAARTVASRQVRNRATVAGALALGDPTGDALAALGAGGAAVEIVSAAHGVRHVAAADFVTGEGACELQDGELVTALEVPVDDGPTAYAKVGARNAMARAVCGVAVALDPSGGGRACAVGVGERAVVVEGAAGELGALVRAAVPADAPGDARASGAYRRHAAGVLAARAVARATGGGAVAA